VILDRNMPKRFRQFLTAHEVRPAREMGWAELENGDLLEAAENAGFEVMVTADKNLSYQQNLEGRKLALVVVSTNDWNLLSKNPAPVAAAVDQAEFGSFQTVSIGLPW
jgi:hypothetical protein